MKARALLPLAALGLVLLSVEGASGHFPLAVADAPWVEKGAKVRIDLTNGHPYVNDRYDSPAPERVLVRHPLGTIQPITSTLTTVRDPASPAGAGTNAPLHRVEYTFRKTGDYVLSWRTRTTEKPQRNVTDYVKLVMHVGEDQVGWWGQLKDPLEIMPLSRPYALRTGDTFRGQVLEDGKPMVGGVVEAETYTDRLPSPLPELAHYRLAERTDGIGCFSVTLDRAGWWLLSCATDGGPGEQGSSETPQERALLWVFVGLDPTVPAGSSVRPPGPPDYEEDFLPQVGLAPPTEDDRRHGMLAPPAAPVVASADAGPATTVDVAPVPDPTPLLLVAPPASVRDVLPPPGALAPTSLEGRAPTTTWLVLGVTAIGLALLAVRRRP